METSNVSLKTIANKLHNEISKTKSLLKQEKVDLGKEMKIEIKQLKREIGLERKAKIKLEHKLETITKDNEKETETIVSSTAIKVSETTPQIFSSSTMTITSPTSPMCNHLPQCALRDPDPPPPFAPITAQEFYSASIPPSTVRLLPPRVSSYDDFRNLNSSHKCEECDEGALFNNYFEMVEYPDPGPCGGTSGSPVATCPNNPNSKVTILPIRQESRRKPWWYKEKSYKCDMCDQNFPQIRNLIFHTK